MYIDKDDGAGGDRPPGQHLRVSDAEREAAAARLAGHFAAGRLDQAGFDQRVGQAMSARTRGDLTVPFAGLPEAGAPAGDAPAGDAPAGGAPAGGAPAGGAPAGAGQTRGGRARGPGSPIEFRLDSGSGVPTYLQLVHQVEHALRLGYLKPGDQLPKVRDVVASLAINPNTVLKAYKELETKGLAAGRPGQGTFVQATLSQVTLPELTGLRKTLLGWLAEAAEAGLNEDGMVALFTSALRDFHERRSGPGAHGGAASGETEGVA
jgi:GntR family transcriptional regulator